MDDQYTDDSWSLYFHDPYNQDWTYQSYVRVCDVCEFSVMSQISDYIGDRISKGMFFLFRESVFPCWDDPSNIDGGSLSFKVPMEDSNRFWKDLTDKMLREEIVLEKYRDSYDFDVVTGISISPKKNFCIVKIWVKDVKLCRRAFINLDPNYKGEVLFKPHRENIQNNNAVTSSKRI